MIIQRVEKHKIKQSNPYYPLIDGFCFSAKNLYNHANYLIRQEFVSNGNWLRYTDLDKTLRANIEYPDYKNMPTAQSAQQLLRLLDKNWKSFFKSIKDWKNNKNKYLGRPKLPKYKDKNDRYVLILTNQNVKLKDDILQFPKVFDGFMIRPLFVNKENYVSFQQVRFIPKANHIELEVIYNVEIPEIIGNNNRYYSIDIGLDNLATVTNNFGEQPFIINGKGLKSENKYYNKLLAHYKSIAMRMNKKYSTKRTQSITKKRNQIVDNYLHQASRYIVDKAHKDDVSMIVIGNNKGWKQKSEMNKRVNQSFIQIPYNRLIEMIQYKAEEYGISVMLAEESYTSGTSFLDNEEPIESNYRKERRVHRGLFQSNTGKLINADVNGSLQILKKVFPNAYNNRVEGVALHPFVVNACLV
ncbi:MAG: transposase [Lachnospiraceae bacterium]|nr:transposase [Lachnospiraceae bacterium]